MSQTYLMCNSGNFKITSPAIVYQNRKGETIGKMFIKSLRTPVERSNDEGEKFSLNRPEPSLLPVDFHSRFVSAINFSSFCPFTDEFVCRNSFFGNPVNYFHQCPFTDRSIKHVPEHFG